jgi:hypothetical protein
MQNKFLLIVFTLCYSYQLTAQSEKSVLPSVKIMGSDIQPFVDSLKQKILLDTLKFDRNDLKHFNGRSENVKPYSMLLTVNGKYNYRMDLIEGRLVQEFVDAILKVENIASIEYVNEELAPNYAGSMAVKGWILIQLKPKVRVSFKVGGLKYWKNRKSKGGDNFLQVEEGELMMMN